MNKIQKLRRKYEEKLAEEDMENDPLEMGENADDSSYNDDFLYNDGLTDDMGYGDYGSPLKKHQDLLKDLTNFSP